MKRIPYSFFRRRIEANEQRGHFIGWRLARWAQSLIPYSYDLVCDGMAVLFVSAGLTVSMNEW